MHTAAKPPTVRVVCINRDTVIIGLAMSIIHIAVFRSTEHFHDFFIACKRNIFKPFDKFRPAFRRRESQWIFVVLLQ